MPPWRRIRGVLSCFYGKSYKPQFQKEDARFETVQRSFNAAALISEQPFRATVLPLDGAELVHLDDDLNPCTLRDSMICNVSPAIITVFSLASRRVMHQNLNSQRYMGSRTASGSRPYGVTVDGSQRRRSRRGRPSQSPAAGRALATASGNHTASRSPFQGAPRSFPNAESVEEDLPADSLVMKIEDEEMTGHGGTGSMLDHIFCMDPHKLERMLADLNEGGVGRVWKGVVRVPPSLIGIPSDPEREAYPDRVQDPGQALESEELLLLGSCTCADENGTTEPAPAPRTQVAAAVSDGHGHGHRAAGIQAADGGGGANSSAKGRASAAGLAASHSFHCATLAQSSTTTTNRSFAGVPAPHTPRHTNTNNSMTISLMPSNVGANGSTPVVSGSGGGGGGSRSSRPWIERAFSGSSSSHAAVTAPQPLGVMGISRTSTLSPTRTFQAPSTTDGSSSMPAFTNSSLLQPQALSQQQQQQQGSHDAKRAASIGSLPGSFSLAGVNPMRLLLHMHRSSRKALSHTQVNSQTYAYGSNCSHSCLSVGSNLQSASATAPAAPLEQSFPLSTQRSALRLMGQGQQPLTPPQRQQHQQQQPSLDDSGHSQHANSFAQSLSQRQRSRGKSLGSRPPPLIANRSRLSLLGVTEGESLTSAAMAGSIGHPRPQSALIGMAAGGGGVHTIHASMDSSAMRTMSIVDSVYSSGSGVEPPAQGDPLATSTFNIALPPSMLPGYPRRKPPKRCASACDLAGGRRGYPPSIGTMTSTSRAVAFASTLRNAPVAQQIYGASGSIGATPTTTGVIPAFSALGPPTSVQGPYGQHATLAPAVRSSGRALLNLIGTSTSRLASGGSGGSAASSAATPPAPSYPVPSPPATVHGYSVLRTTSNATSILRRQFGSPSATGAASMIFPTTAAVPLTEDVSEYAGPPSLSFVRPSTASSMLTGTDSGPGPIPDVWQRAPLTRVGSTTVQTLRTPSHDQPRLHVHTHNSSTGAADCMDPLDRFSDMPIGTSMVLSPFCTASAASAAAGEHAGVALEQHAVQVVGVDDEVSPEMSSSRIRQDRPRSRAVLASDPDGVPDGDGGDSTGTIAFLSNTSYGGGVPNLTCLAADHGGGGGQMSNVIAMSGMNMTVLPSPSTRPCVHPSSRRGPVVESGASKEPTVPEADFLKSDPDGAGDHQVSATFSSCPETTTAAAWIEHNASQRNAASLGTGSPAAHQGGGPHRPHVKAVGRTRAGTGGGGEKPSGRPALNFDLPTRTGSEHRGGELRSPAVRPQASTGLAGLMAVTVATGQAKILSTLMPHLLCSNLSTVRETQSVVVSEATEGVFESTATARATAAASSVGNLVMDSGYSMEPDPVAENRTAEHATTNAEDGSAAASHNTDKRNAHRSAAVAPVGSPPPPPPPPPASEEEEVFLAPSLCPSALEHCQTTHQPLTEAEGTLQPPAPRPSMGQLAADASTGKALLSVLGPRPGTPRGNSHPAPVAGAGSDGGAVLTAENKSTATVEQSTLAVGQPGSCLESMPECWHEVWASRAVDPVTGDAVLVLAQHDVSAKVIAERHLALVMETEHRLLEQLFPRHILAYITEEWTCEALRAAIAPPRPDGSFPQASNGQLLRPTVRDCTALATWHEQVTLLFADIKGFTPMCKQVEPRAVMSMLNDLYSRYDKMLDKYGVFKVETIGDCYFVAGGLMHEDEDGMVAVRGEGTRQDPLHARKVFMFAKGMLEAAKQVAMPTTGEPVQIRIGIATGPVVSGVVGQRMPRFCLFGDTVNTASRMESTGVPGAIHVSQSTYELLRDEAWLPTGGIEVKGKGLMQTYLWRDSLVLDPITMDNAVAAVAAAAAPAARSTAFGKTPSQTVQNIAQVSNSVAQLQDLLLGSVAERVAAVGGGLASALPAGISDQGLAVAIAEGLLQRVTSGLNDMSTCSDYYHTSGGDVVVGLGD